MAILAFFAASPKSSHQVIKLSCNEWKPWFIPLTKNCALVVIDGITGGTWEAFDLSIKLV